MGALSSYLLIVDISREASTIERHLALSSLQLHDAYLARCVTLPTYPRLPFPPAHHQPITLSSRRAKASFLDAIGRYVLPTRSGLACVELTACLHFVGRHAQSYGTPARCDRVPHRNGDSESACECMGERVPRVCQR